MRVVVLGLTLSALTACGPRRSVGDGSGSEGATRGGGVVTGTITATSTGGDRADSTSGAKTGSADGSGSGDGATGMVVDCEDGETFCNGECVNFSTSSPW